MWILPFNLNLNQSKRYPNKVVTNNYKNELHIAISTTRQNNSKSLNSFLYTNIIDI